MTDTIFALATPQGKSGVCVFRISGEKVRRLTEEICGAKLVARKASLRKIHHHITGDIIDHALLLRFEAPHSFTGEDTLEIHSHGSYAVIDAITRMLSDYGIRIAEAGEFSKRAFHNGKMDLTQLEGLADLIDAQTQMQQKQALRQMEGELEVLYNGWRRELIECLSLLEAYIDFPDEEIPSGLTARADKIIALVQAGITEHLADNRGEILRRGFRIAIIGKPNVGKSSLLNLLAKRDVAIISDIAGTTRDCLEVSLDIDGYAVLISDTAGLHETQDIVEIEGIRRAKNAADNADLVLYMCDDGVAGACGENFAGENFAGEHLTSECINICNKSDIMEGEKGNCDINISVKTGNGVEELMAMIGRIIKERLAPTEEPILSRARHRQALEEALGHIEQYIVASAGGLPLELVAEDIRLTARTIGRITGAIQVDDILDKIFSSFCIGK